MRVEKTKIRKKRMRGIAGLLAAVLFFAELNTGIVYASQTQAETEVDGAEENSTEAETDRAVEESDTEAGTEETVEESSAEAETDGAVEESGTEAETDGTVEESIEAVEENGLQSVTEDASVVEKVPEEEAELDYILGREMTEEEIAAQKALEPDYLPEIEVFELPETKVWESDNTNPVMLNSICSVELEESYDARELGIYNDIENQYNWGTCWAFSALDLMESSLIQKDLAEPGEINLSERHLAYFVGNTGYDVLGNAEGDTVTSSPATYYLSRGGNFYYAAMKLMNWHGGASESEFEYISGSNVPALETESAQEDIAHIENCYWIATEPNDADTIQDVKQMVKQYGGVSWSCYFTESYMNYSTAAYYNNVNQTTNHAIIIVGWDDTYAKENFGTTGDASTQPASNGAWIVRNSWGSGWGKEGYFYISYEDTSLGSGNGAAVMTAELTDDYDNNYFYGNTVAYKTLSGFSQAAQVYQIKGRNTEKEQIRGISFMLASADTEYSIQIYKNPVLENGVITNPESGEAMLETPVTGQTSYAGLYTIELPTPVTLSTEDYAAVVITFPEKNGYVYVDASDTTEGTGVWTNTNVTAAGQSFYGNGSSSWTDLHNSGYSFRINMLTDDVEEEITIPAINGITVTEPDGFDAYVNYKIRWSKCTDVTGYEIYRSTDENGEYTKIGSTDADVRYYNDTVEKADWKTKYYYKVRAVYDESTWEESEAVSAQAEGVLRTKINSVNYSKEKITVNWTAVGGAVGYRIERKEKEETEYQQIADITDQSVVTYTDDVSELSLGYYEYRVQAYNETEEAEWSEVKTVAKDLKLTPASYCKVKYEWLPVENAAKYKLCVVTRNSGYKYTKKWILNAASLGEKTYYTLDISTATNFKVGDTLEFFVEACDSDGVLISTSQTAYTSTEPDPLTVNAAYSGGKIRFSWTGGEGADTVYIYRSMNENTQESEPYAEITDMETVEFEDDNIAEAGTYYYRIYPGVMNSSGTIIYGEGYTFQQKVLRTVMITEVTGQGEQTLKIAWKAVEEADDYIVYRAEEENGNYAAIAEKITESEYTDSTVITGKNYYYKVTFCSGEEESVLENTAAKEGKTLPETPVLSRLSYNKIVIENHSPFSYALVKAGSEAKETDYVNSSEAELAFTGLVPATEYVVYVRTRKEITGEDPVYGESLKVTTEEYPIAETDQLSAVNGELKLEAYFLNENSKCSLQIQNQNGELQDIGLFTFTSVSPQVCVVSPEGMVTANPEFAGKTDTRVKITAVAADDPAARKVEFYVTVLTKKYTDVLEIENVTDSGSGQPAEKIDSFLGQKFEKGNTMTLTAAAYDVSGVRMENPAVTWKISDTSVASLKKNKDGTITVTWKEAGRVTLTCAAEDEWQRTKIIQLGALSTEPVISATQVILNKKAVQNSEQKKSGSFTIVAKNGATAKTPIIAEIRTGNKVLTRDTGANYFSVLSEEDGSYRIAVDDVFLNSVKNNTVYTLTMQTEISGIPELEISESFTESFKIKLKITDKEPTVTVKAAQINRFYMKENDLTGLLTIKAPDEITNVRVLTQEEGQINSFEQYFSVKEKDGQWYLQFQDVDNRYNKRSISGKLELTVNGYTAVVRKITVKTPSAAPSVKQQNIPAIHIGRSSSAAISLYNSAEKTMLDTFEIQDVQSESLEAVRAENGTVIMSVKDSAQYKDGAALTATLKIMALDEKGEAGWKSPLAVKVKVKVYKQKKPSVTVKTNKLTLNRQTSGEKTETTVKMNCVNVNLLPEKEWKIYTYNSRTKHYELPEAGEKESFLFGYDEESGTINVGFAASADLPEKGSYKFRISNFVEAFEEITKDFTVKVIDETPAAKVKAKGKLDLIKRADCTLGGKFTLKNISSEIVGVTILNEERSGTNEYYYAALVNNKEFKIELTAAGREAAMTTAKVILPVQIRLKGGTCILTTLSFKPVQSTPSVKTPKTEILYKSVVDDVAEYDMKTGLNESIKIKRMDLVNVPDGMEITAENGSLSVKLSNRGIKRGTYKIKVNIYFEGAQAIADSPDGKPLTKTIKVKVVE